MKPEENIKNMEKHFMHIVNHMRTMGKVFINENLVKKFLRCLNCSSHPKVTLISELKNLSYMNFATLFGKNARTRNGAKEAS